MLPVVDKTSALETSTTISMIHLRSHNITDSTEGAMSTYSTIQSSDRPSSRLPTMPARLTRTPSTAT